MLYIKHTDKLTNFTIFIDNSGLPSFNWKALNAFRLTFLGFTFQTVRKYAIFGDSEYTEN
jgi:hypothetical protein